MVFKFGVIGNCQRIGFARSLASLVPGCEVKCVWTGDILRNFSEGQKLAQREEIDGCDIVFSQPINDEVYGPFRSANLKSSPARIMLIPAIAFTGFHPDCIM